MMPQGFFDLPQAQPTKTLSTLIPSCGACQLYRNCRSPKMPYTGRGERKILVVGECAGKTEDVQGRQFVGKSGQLLKSTLEKFDIEPDRDCWFTNSVICRPHKNDKNRNPTDKEVDYCRPTLLTTIKELEPNVVIPLGGEAVRSLISYLWKPSDIDGIGKWSGWKIPAQKINSYVCPTFHPSYILRTEDKKVEILKMIWEKHLKSAVEIQKKPFNTVPDYKKQVQVILNHEEAAKKIRLMTEICGKDLSPVAWDFECEGLKPDTDRINIVSCSMSDGTTTIAYPWYGQVVEAMKEFLRSPIPKIAANLKYESRFAKAKLGLTVKNWAFDTMLAAHVLDNRPGISSLKFQAFVLLGQPCYDEHINPYLKADGSNSVNRIKELDLRELLIYNGMDSLLELKVAKKQAKQLGVKL